MTQPRHTTIEGGSSRPQVTIDVSPGQGLILRPRAGGRRIAPELRLLRSLGRGFAGFVVEATDQEILAVAAITAVRPDWVVEQKNAADPWVVARAAQHNAIIVTHESMKGPGNPDRNLRIPNVAAEHGVTCLRWNDLARAEGWTFGAT